MNKIEVFYDIISPYSFLALELLKDCDLRKECDFTFTPVALGAILGSTGNPGPAGIELKRSEALRDCCMQAQRLGVNLQGPPKHPFNTLPALRFLACLEDQELRLEAAIAINHACWSQSKPADTEEALQDIMTEVGLMRPEWEDIYEFIKANKGRQVLKKNTARALELKVFGVPTFRINDTMNFWGSDRFDLIRDYIARPDFYKFDNYERMLNIESGLA